MGILRIYTDASGYHKEPHGGVGFVVVTSKNKVLGMEGNYIRDSRTERLELLAVINAIHHVVKSKHINFGRNRRNTLLVHSDASYVVNNYNRHLSNWMANRKILQTKKHYKLWEQLHSYSSFTKITKVKGHAGDPWNELADYLAGKSRILRENFYI